MSDLKLLNCPFCGGEAEMLNYSPTEWLVHCIECDGMVENWRKTEQEAIEQWNRRTPMDNIMRKLEERRIEYELSSENAPDAVSSTYRKGVMRGYEYSRDLVKQEINNGLE